jgi:hypothetical protein
MRATSGGEWNVVWRWVCLLALASSVSGCFWRDPLDPRGQLDHRVVKEFDDAERITQSHRAFERARQHLALVQPDMSPADVETAMQAIVVTEQHGEKDQEGPRRKFVDGLLCRRDPTPLRQRWLFGYDEGGVELVGFAIEFERDNPEKEKWTVRGIDRAPTDDCPEPGE